MNASRALVREIVRITAPLLILGMGLAGFWILWGLKKPPGVAPLVETAPTVEVIHVEPHHGGLEIVTDGLVAPARDVTIATQVAGRITYKSPACQAGEFVTEGVLLFRIDKQDYQLEVDRLTKEREQADSNLQEVDLELQNTESLLKLAQEDLELQQRELQRQLQLRGQAVSQSVIDQSRRAELAARNALQMMENQRRLLGTRRSGMLIARDLVEVRLDKARLDLERTEVKSPVTGVVVEEMVEEDSFVPIGAALAKIEDTSTVEVRCSLKMDELRWLWRQPSLNSNSPYRAAGYSSEPLAEPPTASEPEAPPTGEHHAAYQLPHAEVKVIYEIAGRRFQWRGVLDRFEGIGVDERTRTVPCRVVVHDPRAVEQLAPNGGDSGIGPPALVRGMYVQLRILAQPEATLVHIPEKAIRAGGQVWVYRNGQLFEEPVEVAAVIDGTVIVDGEASHLHAGDQVIITPLALIRDGMEVEAKAANDSASNIAPKS
jgi:multidrug efflux pump subunit AcrA (membrane-fusion protein)